MKEYQVKVVVTETHYITVEAKNIAEAEDKGESYGFHAEDPVGKDVQVQSVQLLQSS